MTVRDPERELSLEQWLARSTPKERHVVLVTGGRDYEDVGRMTEVLGLFPRGSLVVHGGANGADLLARAVAATLRMPTCEVPYMGWLGRGGGPARNRLMVEIVERLCDEDVSWSGCCVAFGGDAGTDNCVRAARGRGLFVFEVDRG